MASAWVFLVERAVEEGAEVALFWRRTTAEQAIAAHLADRWPLSTEPPSDVDDAIEQYNQVPAVAEHVVLDVLEIHGDPLVNVGETHTVRGIA